MSEASRIGLQFRPRIYLAVYMAIAGYLTSALLGELIFYIKSPSAPFSFDLSLLLPYYLKDFLKLGIYLLSSYFLLPPKLSSKAYKGRKAFWGGMLAFFAGSLFNGMFSVFHILYFLGQPKSNSLGTEISLPLIDLLINLVPILLIISLILAPVGGFFSWLAYCYLYPRREKYWTQKTKTPDVPHAQ